MIDDIADTSRALKASGVFSRWSMLGSMLPLALRSLGWSGNFRCSQVEEAGEQSFFEEAVVHMRASERSEQHLKWLLCVFCRFSFFPESLGSPALSSPMHQCIVLLQRSRWRSLEDWRPCNGDLPTWTAAASCGIYFEDNSFQNLKCEWLGM